MVNMKYKVGDKVRIKSLDWYNKNKDSNGNVVFSSIVSHFCWRENVRTVFTKDMTRFCGKVVTIETVWSVNYSIVEGTNIDYFTDGMIECLVEEKTKPETKFKVGDKIISDVFSTKDDKGWKVIDVERTGYKLISVNNPSLICDMDFKNEHYYKLVEEETLIDLTVKGEEIKERIEIAIPEGYEYVIESGKIIFTKKKPKYPKTFEECVSVLMLKGGNRMPLELMNTFRKLIDARNSYWTIYGIENGLGKPWEPDWRGKRYVIYRNQDDIIGGYREAGCVEHHIFEFPTKEMRDAFRENFGSDIEFCKEFL